PPTRPPPLHDALPISTTAPAAPDLGTAGAVTRPAVSRPDRRLPAPWCRWSGRAGPCADSAATGSPGPGRAAAAHPNADRSTSARSEEHTSELQSRENL